MSTNKVVAESIVDLSLKNLGINEEDITIERKEMIELFITSEKKHKKLQLNKIEIDDLIVLLHVIRRAISLVDKAMYETDLGNSYGSTLANKRYSLAINLNKIQDVIDSKKKKILKESGKLNCVDTTGFNIYGYSRHISNINSVSF